MGAPVNSERWRSFLLQLAGNCAAAAIAPVFVLLLGISTQPGILLRSFTVALAYANAIGFTANLVIPRLYPAIARHGRWWEWTAVTFTLALLSGFGCLMGTAAMAAVHVIPWNSYGAVVRGNFGVCLLITLAFGLTIAAFSRMQHRLQHGEVERERALKLASEAQLASLESRLHPHFLFNTMNSISALIPVDPQRAERLMERMAALLRFSLDAHAHGLVPLEQELKIVRDYLEIEQARLGARLRFHVDDEGECRTVGVPPLSLQTLVENSIKYAIAPDRQGGEIRVAVSRERDRVHLAIADTGPGFDLQAAPSGHGLENLQNRLTVLFDGKADLALTRQEGWTTIRLTVPA